MKEGDSLKIAKLKIFRQTRYFSDKLCSKKNFCEIRKLRKHFIDPVLNFDTFVDPKKYIFLAILKQTLLLQRNDSSYWAYVIHKRLLRSFAGFELMFEVSIISLDDRIIINRLLYYASVAELTKLLSTTFFFSSKSFLIIDFMNKHNESNINLYFLSLSLSLSLSSLS